MLSELGRPRCNLVVEQVEPCKSKPIYELLQLTATLDYFLAPLTSNGFVLTVFLAAPLRMH